MAATEREQMARVIAAFKRFKDKGRVDLKKIRDAARKHADETAKPRSRR